MIELSLPAMHAGQKRIWDSTARYKVVACGRRYGKSLFAQIALTIESVQSRICAYFAPTDKALHKFWSRMKVILAPVTASKNEQKKVLYLRGGGEIWFWSLENFETIRGGDYDFVVVDEACIVRKLAQAWQEVIRPTLIDRAGRALFLSTPRGRDFFYELFERGRKWNRGETTVAGDGECSSWADEWPEWESFHAPTASNPYIAPSEVAGIQKELPELAFRQEILAEFLDADGAVFRRVLDAAVAPVDTTPVPDHQYVFGCDFGRTGDYTVISVVDATTREQVAIDRFTGIEFVHQQNRIAGLASIWKPSVIIAEANSFGQSNIEALQRMGLPVSGWVATNATKAKMIDDLALAFERADLKILPHPVQKDELLAFEATKLPSGLTRYAAPQGYHDDCVIALALSNHAARRCLPPPRLPDLW